MDQILPLAGDALRHELQRITERDLDEMADWVPPGARELIRVLGKPLALRLFNIWPGAVLSIPLAESNNRRGQERRQTLDRALGADDARTLCMAWGGERLRVPVMLWMLREKRQRWIRTEYAALMDLGRTPSKAEAIYELGLRLTAAGMAMTSRQIDNALDATHEIDERQGHLFDVKT